MILSSRPKTNHRRKSSTCRMNHIRIGRNFSFALSSVPINNADQPTDRAPLFIVERGERERSSASFLSFPRCFSWAGKKYDTRMYRTLPMSRRAKKKEKDMYTDVIMRFVTSRTSSSQTPPPQKKADHKNKFSTWGGEERHYS